MPSVNSLIIDSLIRILQDTFVSTLASTIFMKLFEYIPELMQLHWGGATAIVWDEIMHTFPFPLLTEFWVLRTLDLGNFILQWFWFAL